MTGGFKSLGFNLLLAAAGLVGFMVAAPRVHAEPLAYIESEYDPRVFEGDEDTRVARAHFIHGDYGLAALYYRRAIDSTRQNSAAWTGLAASYDRIGRYEIAQSAYRQAARLGAKKFVLLNNQGYQHLLRGDRRGALRLFYRALRLAPNNPTIANNIAVAEQGQHYFWDLNH